MIFRKPYALLIKYFKFIHIIISIFMIYLIYKTNNIYNFFKSYVKSGWLSINSEEIAGYIGSLIYFSIIIIIILAIVVFLLMRVKNKPRLYYLLTPILYFAILILFIFSSSSLGIAENDVINPITARILRDMFLISLGIQFCFVIFSILRAIGFDIKKFNFKQDIVDLQIEDLDNEEVEVNFEIDKHKIGRKLRRKFRNSKYLFKENKFVIYLLITLLTVGLSTYLILNTFVFDPLYKEGKTIELNRYNLIVNRSYITNKDYLGNEISQKSKYVLVEFSLINKILDNTFNIDNLSLFIDGVSYSPSTNLYPDFIDLGNGYKDQKLNINKINKYFTVFKIPNNINTRKVILRYLNNIEYDKNNNEIHKYKRIRLNPVYTNNNISINKNIGEETNINGNIFNIKEYNINDSFSYNYKMCITKDNCSTKSSSVVPKYSHDSKVLRLVIDGVLSDDINYSIKNYSDYFAKFGSITYTKNGKTYRQSNLSNLSSNTFNGKEIFLEITKQAYDAENINFEFLMRNAKYSFKLK